MFESHKQPLLPFPVFLKRVFRFTLFAVLLITLSVAFGTVGYRSFAGLSWLDSFYMACMILTGMGPTIILQSPGAEIFSSAYALYSGIAFLSISAVLFTPFIHRLLHKLHVDDSQSD